jgi:hypothetical protein
MDPGINPGSGDDCIAIVSSSPTKYQIGFMADLSPEIDVESYQDQDRKNPIKLLSLMPSDSLDSLSNRESLDEARQFSRRFIARECTHDNRD